MINRLRLRSMIRKEIRQMRRNPVLLRVLIIAPVFQLIVFGYAATTDIKDVPVVIADESHSRESRDIVRRVEASHYFVLVGHVPDYRELKTALDAGRAQLALHIPPDFARDLRRGRSAQVGLYVDGSDAITANTAASYVSGLLLDYGGRVQARRLSRIGAFVSAPTVEMTPRIWYNPDLRSANFMVPGVFGLIIMVVTTVWTSQSIVKERELGTLEQLLVTPYAVTALFAAGMIVLLAVYWFGVPLRGDLPLLFALAAVFILTSLGLGLVISTVSQTQQQALLAAFFVLMPAILLSGFMFPIENMPEVIQWLSFLIPYRYFLEICRGVFLRGVGLEVLWPQAVTLLVFGVVLFSLGAVSFRKHL